MADEVRSGLIVRRQDAAAGVERGLQTGVSESLPDDLRRDPDVSMIVAELSGGRAIYRWYPSSIVMRWNAAVTVCG